VASAQETLAHVALDERGYEVLDAGRVVAPEVGV
jgi:hypothetical protein